ncbi:MAG: hypothetical protein IAE88_11630 [Rhodobacteraceae bacterium]|nr:hypothetical protein [Paracoccaceae bacterium]
MAWVPIEDATGVNFTFTGSLATLTDSVVTKSVPGASDWGFSSGGLQQRQFRITALEFSSGAGYTSTIYFGPNTVENAAADPAIGWSPSPIETGMVYGFGYWGTSNGLDDYQFLVEVWDDSPDPPGPPGSTSYNCACDDDYPRTTLKAMRERLARRLGFSVQVSMNALPPGMADLLDDFIRSAQEFLYREYNVFRMERIYTWDLLPGVRFYDFAANVDECAKRMDPREVTWVGISQGATSWRPLHCGIDPTMYGSPSAGIPSHYEIRQCIEVWPPPSDATWKLRIKGHFGLQPLTVDAHTTTIDPEAIFLLALANAKAHYEQPDARNYANQATAHVRRLIAGSHHTRRYIPGTGNGRPTPVRPIPVGGWPES